jgi:hypothetical protein
MAFLLSRVQIPLPHQCMSKNVELSRATWLGGEQRPETDEPSEYLRCVGWRRQSICQVAMPQRAESRMVRCIYCNNEYRARGVAAHERTCRHRNSDHHADPRLANIVERIQNAGLVSNRTYGNHQEKPHLLICGSKFRSVLVSRGQADFN